MSPARRRRSAAPAHRRAPVPSSPRAGFARWRVPLGFAAAGFVLWLAQPSVATLQIGLPIAVVGQLIRIWAAGHLEKSREVTSSGPYRFTRHPLYLGSTLMGVGLAVAANHWLVAALIAAYLGATFWSAIHAEEAYLRATFGDTYDRYAEGALPTGARRFSLERARRNREYRAPIGLVLVALFLIWKATR